MESRSQNSRSEATENRSQGHSWSLLKGLVVCAGLGFRTAVDGAYAVPPTPPFEQERLTMATLSLSHHRGGHGVTSLVS